MLATEEASKVRHRMWWGSK